MKKEIDFYGFGTIQNQEIMIVNHCIVECSAKKLSKDLIIRNVKEIKDKQDNSIINTLMKMHKRLCANMKDVRPVWIELCTERVNKVKRNNTILSISIEKTVNNKRSSYPIGVSLGGINNIADIYNTVEYINEMQIEEAELSDRKILLTPYAAGIILHELIGHLREYDNSQIYTKVENAKIIDSPKGIIDYTYDDNGVMGHSVNLIDYNLSSATGNTFLGINEKRQIESLIRQRNLIMSFDSTEMQRSTRESPIMPVYRAGFSKKNNCIQIITSINGVIRKLSIPSKEIESLRAINGITLEMVGICHKHGCPHYFGIKTPWAEMTMERKVEEYQV